MSEFVSGKKIGIRENLFSLRTLLGFMVAGFVTYLFLTAFSLDAAVGAFSKSRWALFLASAAVFYGSLPLRGGRWGSLLAPAGHQIGRLPLTHYYFLAWFANVVLPARIGDLYRAYLLKKNKGVPVPLSLGVLFSERVFDLAVTGALVAFSGAYFWSLLKGSTESSYLIWGMLAVVAVIAVFIAAIKTLPLVEGVLTEKWKGRVKSFNAGLLRLPSLFPKIILMTLAIWLSEALRLYLVFLAFGIHASFLMALFVSQASLILMALPVSPSGLGLVEFLMLKILSNTGTSPELAGAITIADRLISYWSLMLIGGIVYLLSTRSR